MRGVKYATEAERLAGAREAQRRYREANREKVREASRAYVKRHPERRQATIKTAWERLRVDPVRYARFLAQGRKSYARHPLTGYVYALNWRGENRERVRTNNRGAAARRRERVGATRREVAEVAQMLRRDPCAYCGKPGEVVDHIVALASGGSHDVGNMTAACRSCNARKRISPLLMFLLKRVSTVAAA